MEFRFEQLLVYQKAVDLSNRIFLITKNFPSNARYSITDQLNRACLSIPLNIAEGSSRTSKDFQHFLAIARGSCYESIPIITIAKAQKFISEKQYEEIKLNLEEISKMLSALRTSISK